MLSNKVFYMHGNSDERNIEDERFTLLKLYYRISYLEANMCNTLKMKKF